MHAVVFGGRVGLSEAQLAATVHGAAGDPVWSERQALVIRLSDELHDTADITDELWLELERHWTRSQLLELIVTAGWYRTISQVVKAARIEPEAWAASFPER